MRTYIPIATIERSDPHWAARIRERERAKRRRLRERPEYVTRELSLERKRYAADPVSYNLRKGTWCKKNPEKRRKTKDNYWRHKRAQFLFSHIRTRAKKLGVPFDLTIEWIESRFAACHCEMSGLPFDFETKRGRDNPTVDRRVADGGYTQDNCRMVLWSINRALSNWGDDYLLSVFRAILAKRGEL